MPTTQEEITTKLELAAIRGQFPSFAETVNGRAVMVAAAGL